MLAMFESLEAFDESDPAPAAAAAAADKASFSTDEALDALLSARAS